MKNKFFTSALAALALCSCSQRSIVPSENDPLRFDASQYTEDVLSLPDGRVVNYRSYECLYYVRNVSDSTYQYLNIYIPVEALASQSAPILMRNYIEDYLASTARRPSGTDATGRALAEGYVVCIPGARGHNSAIDLDDASSQYNGRCPFALCDLKAAVRYLRFNDALIPGSSERIIVDGLGAGAAFSALLGATGNSPLFAAYLSNMGAAEVRDDVYASICFTPITDLEHSDMAYEWTFGSSDFHSLDEAHVAMSKEYVSQFSCYIDSLALVNPFTGDVLTSANYSDYMHSWFLRSVQRAVDGGCDMPVDLNVHYNVLSSGLVSSGAGNAHKVHLSLNTGKETHKEAPRDPSQLRKPRKGSNGNLRPRRNDPHAPQLLVELSDTVSKHGLSSTELVLGDYVMSLDYDAYLSDVIRHADLKGVPSFDSYGVLESRPSFANMVFGNMDGNPANFTGKGQSETVGLYNPMLFIGRGDVTVAANWYIRHGSFDTETSFPISINLATKLMNNGYNVDFLIAWNRYHTCDYNLDDIFSWLKTLK